MAYADGHFTITLGSGGADQTLEFEKVLVAAGRRPNLSDLGLETVGLDPGAKNIDVDDRMVAGDGLWAIGDVVGHGAWTHLSMYHSAVAVASILGQDGPRAEYHAVPARDLHRSRGRGSRA